MCPILDTNTFCIGSAVLTVRLDLVFVNAAAAAVRHMDTAWL